MRDVRSADISSLPIDELDSSDGDSSTLPLKLHEGRKGGKLQGEPLVDEGRRELTRFASASPTLAIVPSVSGSATFAEPTQHLSLVFVLFLAARKDTLLFMISTYPTSASFILAAANDVTDLPQCAVPQQCNVPPCSFVMRSKCGDEVVSVKGVNISLIHRLNVDTIALSFHFAYCLVTCE